MGPTLLLWDIDGTLINSGGAGMRALRAALPKVFGVSGSLDGIEFAGRTDRWIMRRIFAKFGVPATEENFTRYAEGYVAALPLELANPAARVLPGVQALLDAAATRKNLTLGLLTGNIRRGAEAKLGFHGLWTYFAFGAFADDSELRNELGPHAVRRAREHAGQEFLPGRIWVIGDTPYDIDCGRSIGANTLAVTTGHFTAEQLSAHQPTALLADLGDAAAFFHLLG
ncbi:MAG: HAD family hydrolase [Opitutaceae bacterium]|nr:HAD family hydrolase [Opitutaceae bacterium]